MKIFSSKKRVAAIGVVTAATLVGGGVAFAYWTNNGAGTGSATTGTTSTLNITADGPIGMVPGGNAQPLTVYVDNPNSYTVQLAGLPAASIDSVTCKIGTNPAVSVPTTWFALGGAINNDIVPSPSTDFPVGGLTLRMLDDVANQDACKGAAVGFQLTVG